METDASKTYYWDPLAAAMFTEEEPETATMKKRTGGAAEPKRVGITFRLEGREALREALDGLERAVSGLSVVMEVERRDAGKERPGEG